MIEKRSLSQLDGRTPVVSGISASGPLANDGFELGARRVSLALEPGKQRPLPKSLLLNKHGLGRDDGDQSIPSVAEDCFTDPAQLFLGDGNAPEISDTSGGSMLYAQAADAVATDTLAGAIESTVGTVSSSVGGGAGAVTSVASGTVGVGTIAAVSGAALVVASDGKTATMSSMELPTLGANSAPVRIVLSANAIHDGTTALKAGESPDDSIKVGDLSAIDLDAVGDHGRFSLQASADAAYFEIREVLDPDQNIVIGHALYYIGPIPDFNHQPSYTVDVEFTNIVSGAVSSSVKTLNIVVTVDTIQTVGWSESAWMSGATLHVSDNPLSPLIPDPFRLNASVGDDWLLGSAGNDFVCGIASGDIFIGGAGTDVVRLDNVVVPLGGPVHVGFYPNGALAALSGDPSLAEEMSWAEGLLSWDNEVFIQAEQIRFMLPSETIWRIFSIVPMAVTSTFLPEEVQLLQERSNLAADFGARCLLLSSEDDWVVFGNADGVVNAGAGNDYVVSVAERGVISGGAGDDWLLAGDPAEDLALAVSLDTYLLGNDGNDVLVAQAGRVNAWGGIGRDVFILAGEKATLTVHDYDPGVDSIVWADLEGRSVYKSTEDDGSMTFSYAGINESTQPSTYPVHGTELSATAWSTSAASAMDVFGMSSATWVSGSWIAV